MPLIPLTSLKCPLDGERLHRHDRQWRCALGHSFDIARQGHVNLLPVQYKKSRDPGDSREMVDARRFFLNSGAYLPLAQRLAELSENFYRGTTNLAILDAGGGDGYYLNAICDALDLPERNLTATSLDISKWAARACASRYKTLNSLVASNKRIPLPDQSQDLLLCLFGFPVYREFARVLKHDGVLIQVDPGPNHLLQLRQILYPQVIQHAAPSDAAAVEQLGPQIFSQQLQFSFSVSDADQRRHLLMMTPHFHRAPAPARERALLMPDIDIDADLQIRLFQRRSG